MILLFLLVLTPAAWAAPASLEEFLDYPQVLILHSYHQNYKWTEDMTKGIQDILGEKAELHFEYMDTKKHSDPAYLDVLADFLEVKAEKIDYDLIISCDNYAFDFIREYRDRLYGPVPLVFCGVNFFEPSMMEGLSNATGFSEENDFEGSLDLIRRTFPERDKLVCILDETLTGVSIKSGLEEKLPRYRSEFESIEIWSRLSMEELTRDLSLLDEHFVVYYIYFQQDRLGHYYEFHHSTRLIGESSSVPVFAAWDFQFLPGILGGVLLQGVEQGQLAGNAALKILEGASIDSFPPYHESPHHVIFDYQMMKRYGLSQGSLPRGSRIVNRPDSFFYRYRLQIVLTLGVFLILLVLIMILLSVVRKLKNSEKKINELNSSLGIKVAKRTEELEFTNNSLMDTLDKLQKTQNELIRNERLSAIGSLVAGVAQEINTPLNVGMTTISYMENNLRDLEKDLKNDILNQEDIEHYLKTLNEGIALVESSLKKTSTLISSFKHLSLDNKGGECLDFDLNEYLEGILMTHEKQFSERQISVSLTGDDLIIRSFPGSFYQITNHLLKNSLVHAFDTSWPDNLVNIRLGMADELTGFMEYRDNGRGIPDELREHIFEPFTSSKRKKGNSGLGLYVVYKTVNEKLRGAVEYLAAYPGSPRPGVCFRIYFPVREEEDPETGERS